MKLVNGPLTRYAGWVNALLAFFYPEWCQVCRKARATPAQGFVCESCAASVKLIHPPYCELCGRPYEGAITNSFVCGQCQEGRPCWSFARSAALAEGVLLEAIHLYKYKRAICVEPFLAGLLVSRAAPTLPRSEWDCIVPVPLHPVKERERDFNQAFRLGRHLARETGIPLHSGLVRRVAHTRTQTRLSRDERFKNVRGAFQARLGGGAQGLRIVLVDDVLTTGATTDACARALLDGGARSVCVWTVARGT